AAADLGLELLLELPGGSQLHLDDLGGAFAERQAVLLLDVLDDRVVELVAADAHRLAGDHAAERDHGDLGGATADVDDHVPGRLVHRQSGTDGGGHRLLDDPGRLAGPGELRSVLHGALLDAGDARGHADDHAGLGEPAAVHLLDEVAQHGLADLEVRDHAVHERTDGLDVRRGLADHPLGLGADRDGAAVLDLHGDHRGLAQDDALSAHVDERVGGAQIDRHVAAQERRVEPCHWSSETTWRERVDAESAVEGATPRDSAPQQNCNDPTESEPFRPVAHVAARCRPTAGFARVPVAL